jgi:beta-barrel assembly-enhancing protease
MKNSKIFTGIFLLLLASQFSLAALAKMFQLTEQQEIQLGSQAAADVEKKQKVLNNEQATSYVNNIGKKLVVSSERQNIAYQFKIIDSKVVNAFALPGGFIYINRGLIESAENENEFVGVLAHEIAHVTERHSVDQVRKMQKANIGLGLSRIVLQNVKGGSLLFSGAQLATQGAFLRFSRAAEREADRVGATMMYKAGWNPNGMVSFFDKLAKKGDARSTDIFSTHPNPAQRRENISDMVANWDTKGKVDSPEFQKVRSALKS